MQLHLIELYKFHRCEQLNTVMYVYVPPQTSLRASTICDNDGSNDNIKCDVNLYN